MARSRRRVWWQSRWLGCCGAVSERDDSNNRDDRGECEEHLPNPNVVGEDADDDGRDGRDAAGEHEEEGEDPPAERLIGRLGDDTLRWDGDERELDAEGESENADDGDVPEGADGGLGGCGDVAEQRQE